jgi:hypothetical protein
MAMKRRPRSLKRAEELDPHLSSIDVHEEAEELDPRLSSIDVHEEAKERDTHLP